MTPVPQKVRKQRRRLLITAILAVSWGLMMALVFVCSWLWRVLVG